MIEAGTGDSYVDAEGRRKKVLSIHGRFLFVEYRTTGFTGGYETLGLFPKSDVVDLVDL